MVIDEFVDKLWNESPVYIEQIKSEIRDLLKYLKEYDIQNYVEIGTFFGGTMWIFSNFMPPNSRLVTVDLSPKYGPDIHSKIPAKNGQMCRWIHADSHWEKTIRDIEDIFQTKQIDLLFIDGNHFDVELDFDQYKHLVKRGGFIVFHDINPMGPEHNIGDVPKFWAKIKDNYRYAEFIAGNPNGYGIGLIHYDGL